jgi:hypothetical protein
MSEEEKKEENQFTSAKELFEHNSQKIIERKEAYYDKIINSLHLTKGKLDLLIILLIIVIILIFVFGSRK